MQYKHIRITGKSNQRKNWIKKEEEEEQVNMNKVASKQWWRFIVKRKLKSKSKSRELDKSVDQFAYKKLWTRSKLLVDFEESAGVCN